MNPIDAFLFGFGAGLLGAVAVRVAEVCWERTKRSMDERAYQECAARFKAQRPARESAP